MATPRRHLGGWTRAGSHGRVFLTADAVEVDEHDGRTIERRRVFLDDIVLITLHHSRSWLGFWITMCMVTSIMFLGLGISAAMPAAGSGSGVMLAVFSCIAAPFVVLVLLFLRPFAVVTVVGRRSRTRMTWWFAHGKAAAIHHELCQVATARNQPPA